MNPEIELFIIRAEDEFILAKNDLNLSKNIGLKESLGIDMNKTFFHSVISHAYYGVFFAAKAYLLKKGIKTQSPNVHKKTYLAMKSLADQGFLDKELVKIYDKEVIKAQGLIEIFKDEKVKRGKFTYNIKSEANLPYAEESITNSRKFISTIKSLIEQP